MRPLLIAITALCCADSVSAQLAGAALWADSVRREIETSYSSGDVERLTRAQALVERALVRYPDDALLLHFQGYAYYRKANLLQGMQGTDTGDLLDKAETSLSKSVARQVIAETQALLSSVIGQKIGSNPIKGMMLGPKSDDWMQKAMATSPENPRVWLLRGIGSIFKPEMFGGGLERAESDLRKAIALFQNDDAKPPMPAWGHAEAYIWLGQVQERAGQKTDARASYLKALEIEPANRWVKDVLLPGLERKGA